MTPAPQPQEHCLCEGVCPSYIISQDELKPKYRGSPCSDNFRTKNCKYDTRSRPAPQPQEDNELEELGNQDIDPKVFEAYANACDKGAQEQYLKEYSATERNATLDDVRQELFSHSHIVHPDSPEGKAIKRLLQSLRTPKEQQR